MTRKKLLKNLMTIMSKEKATKAINYWREEYGTIGELNYKEAWETNKYTKPDKRDFRKERYYKVRKSDLR